MSTIGGDIDFDTALGGYGDNPDALDAEIKRDLLREITTTLGSRPFDRSAGIGIDLLENETASEINYIIYRLIIVSAIARYNARVPEIKRVVVSQDFIDIEDEGSIS